MTSPYKLQQTFCHRDGDPTFLRHDVRTELVHHLPVVFSSYSIPTTRSIDGSSPYYLLDISITSLPSLFAE